MNAEFMNIFSPILKKLIIIYINKIFIIVFGSIIFRNIKKKYKI